MEGEESDVDCTTPSLDADDRVDDLLRRLLRASGGPDVASRPDVDLAVEELGELVSSRSLESLAVDEVYVEQTLLDDHDAPLPRLLLTATGLTEAGEPEPLGFVSGRDAPAHLAARLFLGLLARGLHGVRRILASPDIGVGEIYETAFPDAAWIALAPDERPDWLGVPGSDR